MTLREWRRVLLLAAVVSIPFIWGPAVIAPDEPAGDGVPQRPVHPPRASEQPPLLHSADPPTNETRATPPFLGVLTNEADAAIRGVLPGSPAAEARLRPGDVILDVGGYPVTTGADLRSVLRLFRAGDEITVRLARGNRPLDVRLVLGARQ